MQILQEDRTHVKGMLQMDQRKWSDAQCTGQAVSSQQGGQEERVSHLSLRLLGFKLCASHTVVPSMVPDISDIKMTPQLIKNIRNDVCDQVE